MDGRLHLASVNDIVFSPLWVPPFQYVTNLPYTYLYFIALNTVFLFNFSVSVQGAFATGDNEGYVSLWDAGCRKRLIEVFAQ